MDSLLYSLFRWREKNSISCLKRVSFIPFLKRHYIFYCLQCTCIKIYQLVFIVCLQTYIFLAFPFVSSFVFLLFFFSEMSDFYSVINFLFATDSSQTKGNWHKSVFEFPQSEGIWTYWHCNWIDAWSNGVIVLPVYVLISAELNRKHYFRKVRCINGMKIMH